MTEPEMKLAEWLKEKNAQFCWRGSIRNVGTVALYETDGMGVMILENRDRQGTGDALIGWEVFVPVSPSIDIEKTFQDFDRYHTEFIRKGKVS